MKILIVNTNILRAPNIGGVYYISDEHSRKIYVGSTYSFRDRFRKHYSKLRHNRHSNKKLQEHFNRKQILFFKIIKLCSTDEMVRLEEEHIKKHKGKLLNNMETVHYYVRKKRKK